MVEDLTRQGELLERLRDVHEFPGPFMFKVIGPNTDVFVAQVVQSVINALGAVQPQVSTRESSGAKHVSVTVEVQVESAEHVLEVYAGFQSVDGVRFVL